MFHYLINASLRFRILTAAAAAVMVAMVAIQVPKMSLAIFPEFGNPTVEIQTEALGLSAEEVESLVTLNLEELLNGVPWLKSIRSKSVIGLSSVILTFERGTDIMKARQMVQERLTLAYALPNISSTPSLLQPISAISRVMMVGITSKKIEETELSLLARWTIKPKLIGVPGVANVAIWGQRLREMQVQVDPSRLRDTHLIQDDIVAAVGNSLWVTPLSHLRGSSPGTGGFIDNQNQRLGVHHKMPILTPEQMSEVAVAPQHLLLTGKRMALGDVTEVTYAHPLMIGDAYVNGGSGLMLVIEKAPSADVAEVTRAVEQALAELKRGLPGVEVNTSIFRLATYLEDSVSNLTKALLIGGGISILILCAFLFNWRFALVSVITIPVSLMAAIAVLMLTGATLNTMVLAGLLVALGVVVADSIFGADNLMRRLRERKESDISIAALIVETTMETRGAAVYAAAIILLALTPIFFMSGIAGTFLEPLVTSYILAILASVVVGLTLTPAVSLMLFEKTSLTIGNAPITNALHKPYEALVRRFVGMPGSIAAVCGVLIVAGVGIWPWLGQSLLPALKENGIVVNWATPPGTSYRETFRITSRVSNELESIPGVQNVSAHIGRAITGDQVVGINSGQIWVTFDPEANFENVADLIRETIDGYPGVDRQVQAYLRNAIGETLTGENTPVVVRIFGHDRKVLVELAETTRAALSNIAGIVDLRTPDQVQEPQVRVRVDMKAAGRANVTPGEVRRSASTVFSGLSVGFLYEDQKAYDVKVWSPPEVRHSITDLKDVLVEKSDRHQVRLGDIAEVSIVSVPMVIRHSGTAPYIDVVAGASGRDLGSIGRDIERSLDAVDFPLEYHAEILGEFAERQGAEQRMIGVLIAALVGVFLLLQSCFGSWRLALIAFLAIPAAAAGGMLAIFLAGGVVSLGSIVGLLAALGIAARSGIVLIGRYQRLEQKGTPFGLDLVLRGAREVLSPVLASAAVIIAALLPIIIIGHVPGLEIVQPTAVAVIGGVVASTLATLLVMPVLYLVFAAGADRQPDLGLADA